MSQLDAFSGATFNPAHDLNRLNTQLGKVYRLMCDGRWRTLGEIRREIGCGSEAAISARLRDFRKQPWFLNVERRRRGEPSAGLWEYRIGGVA